jgi:hypothetical protein
VRQVRLSPSHCHHSMLEAGVTLNSAAPHTLATRHAPARRSRGCSRLYLLIAPSPQQPANTTQKNIWAISQPFHSSFLSLYAWVSKEKFVTAIRPTAHSIMVGITLPYSFAPVSQQDRDPTYDFDPKAVTRASYYSIASSTSTPAPKQQGPLIDFNRHPDSYIIVPTARSNVPPMHPNTKQRINTARWIQFSLRLLQLVGALGALVCVIVIRGVNDVQGWILRIPVSMILNLKSPVPY